MRKILLAGTALLFSMTFGMPLLHAQQPQQPQQQQIGPNDGWQCPRWWMGQGGRGRMMRYRDGSCGMGPRARFNRATPLTKDEAKQLLESYMSYRNNPNLKLGEIADKGDMFEAPVTTKDGSLVEKIQVDKKSGWFRYAS